MISGWEDAVGFSSIFGFFSSSGLGFPSVYFSLDFGASPFT
jgi:hypothetical protein